MSGYEKASAVKTQDCAGQSANAQPIMRQWTREQLQNAAKVWVCANNADYTKESYYANLGLLIDFVTDLFDGVNVGHP